MVIEQTIDIPVDHRLPVDHQLSIELPRKNGIKDWHYEFDHLDDETARQRIEELKRNELPRPQTVEDAIKQAEEQAAKPGRIPISSYFGIMKDYPLDQSSVEYQRSIRDEWD